MYHSTVQTPRTLNQRILAIAWPMTILGLSTPLLGVVDTALLGHLEDSRHLTGVAIASNFIGLLYWSFSFLKMGTTGLAAQDYGANSKITLRVLQHAVAIAIVASLFIFLMIPIAADLLVSYIDTSNEVRQTVLDYLLIRQYGAVAVFINFAVIGWLVGIQKPKLALLLAVAPNVLNIVLDIWFIHYLNWGAKGAAAATVTAEFFCLSLAGITVLKISKKENIWDRSLSFDRRFFITMLQSNGLLFLRTLLLMCVINFFIIEGDAYGDAAVAANAIILQLITLAAFVLDGFSHACEALVGEEKGKPNVQQSTLHTICLRAGLFMFGSALLLSSIFFIGKTPISGLFTDIPEVLSHVSHYYLWAVLIPIIAWPAYLLDGIHIGLVTPIKMLRGMVIATLLFFIPYWWLLKHGSTIDGNHGLWLSFALFHVGRVVGQGYDIKASLRLTN